MYPDNYTDAELFPSERFRDELAATAQPLQLFRDTLKQGRQILEQRFKTNRSSYESVPQRAWFIDQILVHAWRWYGCKRIDEMALIAVGGYGRGELHPASDIDLMILFAEELNGECEKAVQGFLTFLWDIGLEVGHSVRNLEDCEREARDDVTVISNLMETRLLAGSESLFSAMQQRIAVDKMWSSAEFFAAKREEQRQRHHKFFDTAYNLEPNIKESPGGLRDIQTLAWVAKRHFGATTLHDLVYRGFLTENEYKSLTECQEFLWRIRCLLHGLAKRREDRLGFDYQRSIAKFLNYQDDDEGLGVEKFMKDYYRTAKEIIALNGILLDLFDEAIIHQGHDEIRPLNKRFQIHNNYIEATDERVFEHYPFALLEIFLLYQQHPDVRGIRASTARLIRHYNYLIDEHFHRDLRARSLFFEIIRQPQGLTRALRAMNRYGILAAYLPDFGRIVGQMQYDLFHVYTVDQHTLFVIRNLRRFIVHPEEFNLCSELMQNLPKPELLYIAGLFHDIAKGRGGDHSVLGQEDAREFCQAHGISDRDARLVTWLVREHLSMSTTAQRQDTTDPDVINAFARRVGDKTHLDYLYLLTVADIRATNPTLWNGWKASLLASLYHKTAQALHKGLASPVEKAVRIQQIKQAIKEKLAPISGKQIDKLWQDLEDDYFLRASVDDLARETHAMLDKVPGEPMVVARKDTQGSTEFLIYARDFGYLFANLVFYLERQNMTIMDAYSVATDNDHSLLTYSVLEANSESSDQERVEQLSAGLKAAAAQKNLEFTPIRRRTPRQLKHFPVPTRLSFNKDHAHNHTVLEVVTTDAPGVLSRIVQALVTCKVQVKAAKIATFGSRVEDIFTVTDANGIALHSPDHFDCVQEELAKLLDEESDNLPQVINI